MLRPLLILTVVLGMASMASAGLSLVVGGVEVGDSITINPSDTIWIGVYDDTGGVPFGGAVSIAEGSGANGSWTGGNGYYAPPATPGGYNMYIGYLSPAYGNEYGDIWYIVDQAATTVMPSAGLQGEYEFHCDAAGDVVINLTAPDLVTILDTITITQIPEPITMALLGLGGLLLRRRK